MLDEEAPSGLGERLKYLRNQKGWTFAQLASRVGVGENAIRRIENGESKQPSFSVGVRLSRALGVTPDQLAFGESAQQTSDELTPPSEERLSAIEDRLDAIPDLQVKLAALNERVALALKLAQPQAEIGSQRDTRPRPA